MRFVKVVPFSSYVQLSLSPKRIKEEDIDRAYLKQWSEYKDVTEPGEPEICNEKDVECVHVSEITYGTARTGGLAPAMIPGLEAEEGLCVMAKALGLKRLLDPSADRPTFVCLDDAYHRRWVELGEVNGKNVVLVGTIDAFLWLPRKFGGPALIPIEKKTGSFRGYRNPDHGNHKLTIATEQGLIYSWLTRVNAFALQTDVPRRGYFVTHELYEAKWINDERAFLDVVKRRVEVALRMRSHGRTNWRHFFDWDDMTKFSKRLTTIKTLFSFATKR